MNQLKIVFMGTATFSEAVLKNLIQHDYNIVQVVSQPDRRVGRKKELKMPEVKVVALEHDIPVFQPWYNSLPQHIHPIPSPALYNQI